MLTVRPTASTSTGSIMAASRQVFNTNSKAAVIHAMINHGYSFNTFENIIRCCDSLVIELKSGIDLVGFKVNACHL